MTQPARSPAAPSGPDTRSSWPWAGPPAAAPPCSCRPAPAAGGRWWCCCRCLGPTGACSAPSPDSAPSPSCVGLPKRSRSALSPTHCHSQNKFFHLPYTASELCDLRRLWLQKRTAFQQLTKIDYFLEKYTDILLKHFSCLRSDISHL